MNMKVVKEGLEKQIDDLKTALQERLRKYNEVFAWKDKRKNENETLKGQLSELNKLRESEGKQYVKELAEEKEKLRREKEKKKKMKEESNNLKNQNDTNVKKAGRAV